MIYTDPKTQREIEVFTTLEEDKKDPRGRGNYTGLEVCTKSGAWAAEIGCWFDEKNRLRDYDGVSCLQMDCIRALRKAGWSVPREFEWDNK